jgi:YggT family protein
MFVFANFLSAIAGVLDVILTAYYWIIIVRALLSWVNPDPATRSSVPGATGPFWPRSAAGCRPGAWVSTSPLVAILAVMFVSTSWWPP